MTRPHRPRIDIAELLRRSRRFGAAAAADAAEADTPTRLATVEAFGPNPGALRLRCFVPEGLPPGAPLLVALHGCTQNAAGFDRGCGWSALAASRGFALLLPEQRQANNPNRCFHWFEPAHTARDGAGEVASILAMVRHMLGAHGLDPARVQVAGFSAGGAMAAALLAAHPEVFAAGAVVAGLPVGAAAGLPQALEAMRSPPPRPPASWAEAVRKAAGRRDGPWPRLAIWHGAVDQTVHPANGEALAMQWAALHGLVGTAPRAEPGPGGLLSRTWHGPDGTVRVEHHGLAGLGHVLPIRAAAGGAALPHFHDGEISAPERILDFLGLGGPAADRAPSLRAGMVVTVDPAGSARIGPARATPRHGTEAPGGTSRAEAPRPAGPANPGAAKASSLIDPGAAIRQALGAAGLLRP